MKFFKADEVTVFLRSQELTKAFVKAVVDEIPDEVFYGSAPAGFYFPIFHQNIGMYGLIDEAKKRLDEYSAINYEQLRKEYKDEVEYFVTLKRKLLVFGILLESEFRRRVILRSFIKKYRIQIHVLKSKGV
ncbi:hypothetical protein AB3329_01845 [Streptococcus sp. H31]|uniref:hypothetical protein n=1 Tax=Streptococcus huangxiaojuni TaxID=3237239 RepID=UPI0034A28062